MPTKTVNYKDANSMYLRDFIQLEEVEQDKLYNMFITVIEYCKNVTMKVYDYKYNGNYAPKIKII